MSEIVASLLVAPLQKFLDWLQRERHHNDAQVQAAICAISEALNASRSYVEDFEGRRGNDRNREFQIANLWATASSRALSVYANKQKSRKLAIQFYTKAEYWRSRLEWSDEKIAESKIAFDDIDRVLKSLITG